MPLSQLASAVVLALTLTLHCLLPSAARADRLHVVKRGQTLAAIAKRYRIRIWDLAMANRIKPRKPLRLGQELVVPPVGVTYVRPGQTLSRIARSHRCSVAELKRVNRIRGHLRVGRRLRLPGYEPRAHKPKDWGKPPHPGVVTLRNGDTQVEVPLVDASGRVLDAGLLQLGALMTRRPGGRDSQDGLDNEGAQQGQAQRPHPRLARLLAHLSDHFGGRPITLISGFRAAGGYTRLTSRHVEGRATDIRIAGVGNRRLWEYCRSLGQTGCGYYPRSTFVHVDARPRNAQWVDWSRPGKRRRYGTLRRPYSRRQRRNPKRPRVGRNVKHPRAVPRRVEVVDARGRLLRVTDDAQPDGGRVAALAKRPLWSLSSWPPRPL